MTNSNILNRKTPTDFKNLSVFFINLLIRSSLLAGSFFTVESNLSKCNSPVDCCSRGLDRGTHLFCSQNAHRFLQGVPKKPRHCGTFLTEGATIFFMNLDAKIRCSLYLLKGIVLSFKILFYTICLSYINFNIASRSCDFAFPT